MGKLKRVLIMAGGTGGHVFPGLAIAKKMQEAHVRVHWLGTRTGLEARVVPEAHIPIDYISISGLRGKGWKELFLAPWRITVAILQALKIIRRFKPDVVLGMGGFVSGPGGIASFLLRCPLVIHEQNAKPGTTNQWLSYMADQVLEGFPDTFTNRKKVVTVGNPVRDEIVRSSLLREEQRRVRLSHQEPLHLLVLGGSLGAKALNQLVPKAIAHIPEVHRPIVHHQTGEKHIDEARQAYSELAVTAKIEPFIVEMDKAYAWADIVLCRAGASTVSELCVAGVGAILVPFPFAVDDHQTANASFMANQQAGLLIQQADLTIDRLVKILQEFDRTPEKTVHMAQCAYQLRRVDATGEVLRICEEICH